METYHSHYTYQSFVDFAINREPSETAKKQNHNSSRTSKDEEWTGTKTFDEAIDLAKNGWNSGLKQLALEDGVVAEMGMNFEPDVVGAVVNVGAYVQGIPTNMWQFSDKREYNLPELTIYSMLTYSAGNDGEKAMNFCRNVIKLVNSYQAKHNVRLIGIFDSKQTVGRDIETIIIKDFNHRFVLNNIAFSFHPSFFRRLWFSTLESKEHIDWGYGSPTDWSKTRTWVEEYHQGRGRAILLPALGDLDQDANFDDRIVEVARAKELTK